MHFSEGKVMVTSCQKRSADQAPNGINGGGGGPVYAGLVLDLRCAFGVPVARPPTKPLDLSLTLTNSVVHVNDVPEHLLTMYPVCTRERVPTAPQVRKRVDRGPARAAAGRPMLKTSGAARSQEAQ